MRRRLGIGLLAMIALLGAGLAWRGGVRSARVTGALVGMPVEAFAETREGLGCLTRYGTLWAQPAPGAQARPLTHFPSGLVGGPARHGDLLITVTADGVASAWDVSAETLAWRKALGAPPVSGPAVGDHSVLVQLWPGLLVCLDAGTGVLRWKLALDEIARPAPMWWDGKWVMIDRADRMVFVSPEVKPVREQPLPSSVLAATADGRQLWLCLAPDRAVVWTPAGPGKPLALHTGACMVEARNNMALFAGPAGELTCLGTSGVGIVALWRRRAPELVTCLSGPLATGEGDVWAVGTAGGQVRLYDALTGDSRGVYRLRSGPVVALWPHGRDLAAAAREGAWVCQLPR